MELKKLMEHISIIPDYRQTWKVEHKLSDILLLTICAVISGAEGWEDIEDFGETHPDFLKQYGDFENGIPVHDTIARVVSCISPAKFHECFINWMRDCHSSDDKDVIAIDGKTLRHSYDKSRRRGAIHVISAFSTMHSLVIGQIKTDEKSNEITAIPELLNMLDLLDDGQYDVILLDLSDGVQGLFDVLRRCTRIYTIVREDGFAAAKLAQYRETLERTDYSDVWERSKKLKLPFFCQLPKDIGNLSSGELAEYTKKVLDADEQGGV